MGVTAPRPLEDRVAVITGAAGGLGSAIARAFLDAGCRVALADTDASRLNEVAASLSAPHRIAALMCDVSDRGAVTDMVTLVMERFHALDIVVNNAGIYPRRAWLEIEEAEWDRVMAVNLKGYFLVAQASFDGLQASKAGRIINVGSLTFEVGFDHLLHYVSSKGAVVGFTRALARELGPFGITVNTISPGAFPTDAEKIHPDLEAYERFILDQQALKRRGKAEDVASVALFLAGDGASFVTGQTIGVNGGWSMNS